MAPEMSRGAKIAIRLLELSPLIVLTLALAVYLALPRTVGGMLLTSALYRSPVQDPAYQQQSQAQLALSEFRNLAEQGKQEYVGRDFGVENASLQDVVDAAWATMQPKELDRAVIGEVLPENHRAQARVRQWERENRAQLYLWVVPVSADTTIAYQYVGNAGLLTMQERLALSGPHKDQIRGLLSYATGEPPVPLATLNSGGGVGEASRTINVASWLAGGHVWESYLIYPSGPGSDTSGYYPELGSFTLDPTSRDGRAWLDRFTSKFNGDVFIVGPVDGAPALLRTPTPTEVTWLEGPRTLGSVVWPKRAEQNALSERTGFALSDGERRLTGGKWGILAVAGEDSPAAGTPAKASVVALAVMNESPAVTVLRQQWGSTPTRRMQAWLAPRYTFALGFLGMLFLASLVVSPTAFMFERRATAEVEMERERERIRREANERVFARLEALSREVESAGQSATGPAEDELARAATGIEDTLEDLRRLLGDAGGGAASR